MSTRVLLVALGLTAILAFWFLGSRDGAEPLPMAPSTDTACERDDAGTAQLDRSITFTVFRGPEVSDAMIEEQLGRAAHYYARHGLSFARDDTVAIDDTWFVGGTKAEIDAALQRAGIDPNAPPAEPEKARRIVCEVTLAPLARFVARHGRGDHVINIVVMRRLAAPGSTASGMLPDLRGLAIAPGLNPELLACIGADASTTPTVLVALDEIARRKPRTVDVTLAHEIGHALGLTHTDREDDLMAVEPPSCLPPLTQPQLDTIAASNLLRPR